RRQDLENTRRLLLTQCSGGAGHRILADRIPELTMGNRLGNGKRAQKPKTKQNKEGDFHRGMGISLINCATTSSVVTPSISRSGVRMRRCRSTAGATRMTSSGVMKSRSSITAIALALLAMAREARGEAPK